MTAKPIVLVTGATGFIGGRIVEAFHLGGRFHIQAAIRQWSSAARIARFPVEMMLCDILDRDQVLRAMEGADAVVHCAVGPRQVIVEGTENVMRAARQHGVGRVVHLSTAEVYGDVTGDIDETCPTPLTGQYYADAKIEAETCCWAAHADGVPVTVLRPSIVYGPFSREWTMGFAARLQSGNWGLFQEYGEGCCNLVYVDDLVLAVAAALTETAAVGEAFHINGPDRVTWNDYFQLYNQALGLPELQTLQSGSSKTRAAMMDLASRATSLILDHMEDAVWYVHRKSALARHLFQRIKRSLDTTPSVRELEHLYQRKAYFNSEKAAQLLGYKPRVDLQAGLRLCVQWLTHHGLAAPSR